MFLCSLCLLQSALILLCNFHSSPARWITRLVGRQRREKIARRHVNCRTHEHRRFESTLRFLNFPSRTKPGLRSAFWKKKVGRDSWVSSGSLYGLDGLGIESCRSQWPSGLRRGTATDRLLGLGIRIPPGAWMLVLCVLYSKRQKAKPGQSRQRSSTDEVQKKFQWQRDFPHPSTPTGVQPDSCTRGTASLSRK